VISSLLDKIRIAARNNGCLYCGKPLPEPAFCPACHEKLGLRENFPLSVMGEDRLYAATLFNPAAKSLLYGYKFYHNTGKRPVLTELLCAYWQTVSPTLPGHLSAHTLVLSIPAHTGKVSVVEPIARPFAVRFGYRFSNRVLRWQRDIQPQHTLVARRKRVDNVKGALHAEAHALPFSASDPPAHILIVDDLTTTGATLREATRALREAGVACPISGLAITHVPLAFQKKKKMPESSL